MNTITPELRAIFWEALDCSTEAERQIYLDRVCEGDGELRARVEGLLHAHRNAGDFLEQPALPQSATLNEPEPVDLSEQLGTRIGLYQLLEKIGEGGMGTVYMAEQSQPLRRRVALKVINPGMDTKQVIARFEAERQALAMMDHPNIAKIFDGGATPEGRPYFVMELVRGIPMTEYCDLERLSIAERLELFIIVCRAVQHAHQKGIIHRDLKPSNVLVTVIDGQAVPKVIDFGVAKAMGQSLTDQTLFTGFHQFIGTPLYMSPEQASFAGQDVDTRSDVYSLGVLLYELLTGTTPFDREKFSKAALDEVKRIIREEEPPKPSTRLSSLNETRATVSANRKTDAHHLDHSVRGDLDWIVMKALDKDRRRRYETANDFATDIARHLTGHIVEACPPSAMYSIKKFVRRNRAILITSGLVILSLVIGTIVSTWQAIVAVKARSETTAALATAQRAIDDLHTQIAQKWELAAGMGNYSMLPDEEIVLGDEERKDPDRILESVQALDRLAQQFPEEPRYRDLLFVCKSNYAVACQKIGRTNESKAVMRSVIDGLTEEFPQKRRPWFRLARSLELLVSFHMSAGEFEEANQYRERAVEILERLITNYPKRMLYMRQYLKLCFCDTISLLKNSDPGLRDPQSAVALARKMCELDPDEELMWKWRGLAEYCAGDWDAAIAAIERCLAMRKDDGWTFLQLVMTAAHAKKGEIVKSRQWFEKARPFISDNFNLGDTPHWLIDEAVSLLDKYK